MERKGIEEIEKEAVVVVLEEEEDVIAVDMVVAEVDTMIVDVVTIMVVVVDEIEGVMLQGNTSKLEPTIQY